MNLANYEAIIFDCDGVLLNSNKIKSQAFYKSALPFGQKNAEKLLEYHLNNGGLSRYVKFKFFLLNILGQPKVNEGDLSSLLESYANYAIKGLMFCEIAEGIDELRIKTKDVGWLVASGGDQKEIRRIFSERNLDNFFDLGVFGSPDNKLEILRRELNKHIKSKRFLFIGDSRYDYEVATDLGMDFIFLYDWSESNEFYKFCKEKNIPSFNNISSLLNLC